ncbi:uncharacterized protein PFLUO_LOCUS4435 [Penicillium psychrofluorescens]|uniref:uncharacterized protein n=1 Tax=Penicillium psychrofluorescens TaxID=3158075 RepID=UPI003CCDBBC4
MAEDSQDPGNRQSNPSIDPQKSAHDRSQSQVGKLWDAFGNPEEPVNVLANAKYKPPGKSAKDANYSELVGNISLNELSNIHKTPCARDSLMTGIGAGFGIGGVRAIFGGLPSLWSAGNWAVGVFAITSLAAYEFCRKRQRDELAGMKQAFEMMQDLKIKQQKDKEKAAAAVTARAEEEKRQKSWTNMSNYKFW